MTRHIIINAQKKSRMLPLPELLNTHKTVGSAISSSNHWNCLRQGLLQRNDVKDIITYNIEQQPLELPTARIAAT
jgi:hypothetical protein